MLSLNKVRKYLKAFKNYVELNKSHLILTNSTDKSDVNIYRCIEATLVVPWDIENSSVKLFYKNTLIFDFMCIDKAYHKPFSTLIRYLHKQYKENQGILTEEFLQEYTPKRDDKKPLHV